MDEGPDPDDRVPVRLFLRHYFGPGFLSPGRQEGAAPQTGGKATPEDRAAHTCPWLYLRPEQRSPGSFHRDGFLLRGAAEHRKHFRGRGQHGPTPRNDQGSAREETCRKQEFRMAAATLSPGTG